MKCLAVARGNARYQVLIVIPWRLAISGSEVRRDNLRGSLVFEQTAKLIDPSAPEEGQEMTVRVAVGSQYPPQFRKNSASHQVVSALLQIRAA